MDAAGNELYEGPANEPIPSHIAAQVAAAGVAPPHPDVEGQNPETKNEKGEADANDKPATAPVAADAEAAESKVARDEKVAKPASESVQDATKKVE